MKKRNTILAIIFLFLCTMSCTTVNAQIFIDEDEVNARLRNDLPPGGFIIPDVPFEHDTTYDFTPIGNGVWLLGALGGAYLLGKRRKKKEE